MGRRAGAAAISAQKWESEKASQGRQGPIWLPKCEWLQARQRWPEKGPGRGQRERVHSWRKKQHREMPGGEGRVQRGLKVAQCDESPEFGEERGDT